ncbi:serine hydrolase domain-containing protein [Neptunicella sp. SCSIO 80796]|uniref:serine hydrolase domain-containing protein n=1 Tax=Neptunicella plasticusilytica TaxID=3117012 RepID=UPI003A4D2422
MRCIVAFVIYLVTCSSAYCQQNDNIDRLFQNYGGKLPGASLAIIDHGQISYMRAYGMANLEQAVYVSADTNFRLASITKQFTATAILLLQQQDKLQLDWTLDKIFTGFPAYGQKITIRHLLQHTSGLWDYEDFVEDIDPDTTTQIRDKAVLAITKQQTKTYFEPGAQFRYSNTGYALLALIVEKYSQQPFAEFLEEHIFIPLGMNHTLAYIKNINRVSGRAFGYDMEQGQWVRKDQSSTSAVLGDGGIYSSVRDLYLWDQALYSGKILPKGILAASFTPGQLNNGSQTRYGYGWHLKRSADGQQVIFHTGSSTSFRNIFYRIPEQQISIIILTNRNQPEEMQMVDFAEKVLAAYQQ